MHQSALQMETGANPACSVATACNPFPQSTGTSSRAKIPEIRARQALRLGIVVPVQTGLA